MNERDGAKVAETVNHIPNTAAYPVRVTLCFRSDLAKRDFMGQLSDGFGEQFCDLDFAWTRKGGPDSPSEGFDVATEFTVDVREID